MPAVSLFRLSSTRVRPSCRFFPQETRLNAREDWHMPRVLNVGSDAELIISPGELYTVEHGLSVRIHIFEPLPTNPDGFRPA